LVGLVAGKRSARLMRRTSATSLTTPYTKQEVVKMESDILKPLQFELGNPTIKIFLRLYTAESKVHIFCYCSLSI
jgi:hypothetical protein